MESFNKILSSFNVQDELNSKIWIEHNGHYHMREDVRKRLLDIAEEFVRFIGMDIFVQDVMMTGSLANYNWSQFSDVDLHIMYNFKDSKDKEEIVKELFKIKKTLFNSTHNIQVKGFDVELYVQDTSEPHVSSGVYSVLFNDWINEPSKDEVVIDTEVIQKKTESWMEKIDNLIDDVEDEDLETGLEYIDLLKEKLKQYRNDGLEREGEYSYENLVFKFLRRNGYIQKLFDFTNELVDKRLSLEQKNII
jgi:hypothetical protein